MRTRRFGVTAWAAITAAGQVIQRFAEQPSETPEGAETVLPERWEGTLVLEDVRTEDDREFETNALTWRELPLPLMYMPDTDMGHMDALICGNIETIARDGQEIVGTGTFDLGGEAGREAARVVGEGIMRWVSVDVAVREFQVYMDGDCDEMLEELNEEEIDAEDEDVDGDGEPEQVLFESGNCHIVYRVQEGVLLGATIVSMPAFGDAVIRAVTAGGIERRYRPSNLNRFGAWPVAMEGQELAEAITAAFASSPPAQWFDDPQLEGPTPVTVDLDTGRVYGHVAQWGVCHRAFQDQCLLAPHSSSGYQEFHTGGHVTTAEGDRVRVGNLTMDGLHAELNLNSSQARRHYEDSTTVWAQVRAGEDYHGIWVSGMVRPGLSDEQVRLAAALALSGDWRRSRSGGMEMIAALSVPVPGFPIGVTAGAAEQGPRVRIEDEQVMALVAAGMVTDCGCGDASQSERAEELGMAAFETRLRRVERIASALEPVARERILERLPS